MSAESEEEKHKQGAYLYFDTNNDSWIRSGKVTGRGFSIRHREHQKRAASKRTVSRFYLRYPSKTSARKKSSRRKGHFENLRQYIALGFEVGNEDVGRMVTAGFDEGGIFSFEDNEKKNIDAQKRSGRGTTMLKKIDMIAYLVELAYDLAISPVDNVSQNPGFESCLGVW